MTNRKKQTTFLNRSSIAKVLLLIYDIFVVNFSYFLALWFRYDCEISTLINTTPEYIKAWFAFVPFNTIAVVLIFKYFRLYRSVWTFAS